MSEDEYKEKLKNERKARTQGGQNQNQVMEATSGKGDEEKVKKKD